MLWYDSIASFKLIQDFRYLQFKPVIVRIISTILKELSTQFICFCKLTAFFFHRPIRARKIKERQEKREQERKYYEEKSNLGHDNGVVYDKPPPYEFQTVALNFDPDDKVDSGQAEPSETPVFIDDNKVNEHDSVLFQTAFS